MESLVTFLKITGIRMADHAARSGMHFASHHHLLLGLVVCTSVVAVLGSVFVSRASATHVQCGDTITQSTTLDSDVVCPSGTNFGYGLNITANDVRVDLAGYTIRGAGDRFNGILGGLDSGSAVQRVVILNGTIEGFHTGIRMGAVDSHIRRLTINGATEYGIHISSDGSGAGLDNCQSGVINCVVRNVVNMDPLGSDTGIIMSGPGNHAWGNTIRGVPRYGILASGDRTRVALNRIEGCGDGFGIFVNSYPTYAIVWSNTVMACSNVTGGEGIRVGGLGDRYARIRLNTVTGAANGIAVYDPAALIAQNDASGNTFDGIRVPRVADGEGFAVVVRQNNADNNGAYGINGPEAIDGGGNTASGNGADCTPNLTCAP
jgi:hypothetical protein